MLAHARNHADRISGGFVASALVVLGLAVLAPTHVAAQGQAIESDAVGGFSAYFETGPHVIVQRGRGSVGTNFDFSSRKANYLTNMTIRFVAGVRGPALAERYGRPRPVLYAGALVPLNESSTIGTILRETSLFGTEQIDTSKYSIEYQTSAMAGIGIEFEVPIGDELMLLRAGLESLHLVSRYAGQAGLEINRQGVSEIHAVRAKADLTQHFLGPALRAGTPTMRFRGVAIQFVLDASLLFDVAGTREKFRATGENGDRGDFSFETGKGLGQISAGLQLRWP